MVLYMIFAVYCFLIAITRFTSAITTLVPDFTNLLGIIMQLFFWFTPIVWDLSMVANHQTILKILQCMPFTYLVTGLRNCFMGGNIVTRFTRNIYYYILGSYNCNICMGKLYI
jgi:ABC-type polysaccharide/polyol phosphate export permease